MDKQQVLDAIEEALVTTAKRAKESTSPQTALSFATAVNQLAEARSWIHSVMHAKS